MKVLMIAEDHCGLPEREIGLLLARSGVELRFIFRTGSACAAFLREQGMNVQELPLRGHLDLVSLSGMRKVMREFQPDVIHAFTLKSCWLAILAQWPNKKAPLVYYRGAIRNLSRLNPADWLVFYSAWVDTFECYSEAVQCGLGRSGIPVARTLVNYYGHRPQWYAGGSVPPQWREKKARFRIGCVANYRKIKGLETLVDALDILQQRGFDFELLLVGRDRGNTLADYVAQAASRDRIKLTGPISEPWGVMKTFDCLVIPSLQEAMGRVTLEALACGVPVVATAVGGIPEVIQSGHNGLLIPPQQPTALATAIASVLENPKLQEQFRDNGRRVLAEKFDIDQTRDRLLVLYRKLTKRGCP
jgi:glycosyltransferase involved in cell wall biosynthesis